MWRSTNKETPRALSLEACGLLAPFTRKMGTLIRNSNRGKKKVLPPAAVETYSQPALHTFPEDKNVRANILVVAGEHFSRPAEAGLNLKQSTARTKEGLTSIHRAASFCEGCFLCGNEYCVR